MTPQERQLVDDLFDRLAKLESAPRDPDAAAAIAQGLRNAPNAVYALVQTVLVQDEALKRAHDRIQELEGGDAPEARSRRLPRLDARRDLRPEPAAAARLGAERPAAATLPAARPGTPARCSASSPRPRPIAAAASALWPAARSAAAVWRAAAADGRWRRLVSRHRGGGRRRRGRRLAAARQHPLDDGRRRHQQASATAPVARRRQPGPVGGDQSGGNLAQRCRHQRHRLVAAASTTAPHGTIRSGRQAIVRPGVDDDDDHDDMDLDPTISTAAATATSPEPTSQSSNSKRPPDRAAVSFVDRRCDQITTTLAPTLTRP